MASLKSTNAINMVMEDCKGKLLHEIVGMLVIDLNFRSSDYK